MATRTESTDAGASPFFPLAGWDAATRWNAAAFHWMAQGWQQWLSLMTTVPEDPALSAKATPQARTIEEGPVAQAEAKPSPRVRAAAKSPARPKARRARG